MSFWKSIEDAHRRPEIDDNENPIPDIFASPEIKQMVEKNSGEEGVMPGLPKYDMEFHAARLVMGREQTDYVNGSAIMEEKDDSERLKEIMDLTLNGKGMLLKKLESFLKDGSVVVWVEWLEPKPPTPGSKKERGMTTEELLSPELLSEDSEDELEPTS